MNLSSLYEAFDATHDAYKQNASMIDQKIKNAQNKIDKLESTISRLRKRKAKLRSPSWIDVIAQPLADAIAAHTGKHASISGPFGLRAELTLQLFDSHPNNTTPDQYDYLTLIPDWVDDDFRLFYDTGRIVRSCVPGSIAELNHFGNESLPLPDTVEEILPLMKHFNRRI